MMYVHDIWVNWFEGESIGYNVCAFHEWKKTDSIELMDQVPVIYANEQLFHYIENDLKDLPDELLQAVYKRAYIKKQHKRIPIDYAFVVTNGKEALVVDTASYKIPLRKSRLIPRQERLVLDLIKKRQPISVVPKCATKKRNERVQLMEAQAFIGLTRKERQLKHVLLLMVDQLEQSARLDELRYWITEWEPNRYKEIQNVQFKNGISWLTSQVKAGWSKKHEEFCRKMAKGQPFFERLIDMEEIKKNVLK
ncbi:DUF3603 family protein [Halalkalibacillus halophilus]|uniref:DUF3603 family protein n=1 Tax=Halalkalibacillus halophilus TaxID=392827 RepID=UPI000481354C|nr:DUF3603 family protein [Halalkalibacillus halophilus]